MCESMRKKSHDAHIKYYRYKSCTTNNTTRKTSRGRRCCF